MSGLQHPHTASDKYLCNAQKNQYNQQKDIRCSEVPVEALIRQMRDSESKNKKLDVPQPT